MQRARRDTTAKARPALGDATGEDAADGSGVGGRTWPGLSGSVGSDTSCPSFPPSKDLLAGPSLPYDLDMDSVTLSPELEQLATEAVAAGRSRDVIEVVAAGIGLLRRQDAARAELLAPIIAAERDGDRLDYLSLEAVEREMDGVITGAARRSA
jgi:Arc/MetJ-type ribon-helix-helix transcriptional regulator